MRNGETNMAKIHIKRVQKKFKQKTKTELWTIDNVANSCMVRLDKWNFKTIYKQQKLKCVNHGPAEPWLHVKAKKI